MQEGMKIACSWSGGKDSCYSLMKAIEKGAVPQAILNMMNENGKISRSHGLPIGILQQQAAAMNLPVITVPTTWSEYQDNFINTALQLRSEYHIQAMVFGDIDLEPHREWEEMVCRKAGVQALLPIWQQDRRELVIEMLSQKIEAMIVSCNDILGEPFLGRMLDLDLLPELEAKGVDVCGENGEFHTVVVNCPIFSSPIKIPPYTKVRHEGYHFLCWEN